jgi:hypothetical protein
MSIVLQSTGGGQITIQEPATASNFTQTLPTATGTVMVSGAMPAFNASMTNTQAIGAATFTNVAFNTEVFDTANCFNNTGSTVGGIPAYAFLPNVAGYYQVSTAIYNQTANQLYVLRLYKNNTPLYELCRATATSAPTINGTTLVYLNGTTDYIQIYFFCSAATTVGVGDGSLVWVSASMARAA